MDSGKINAFKREYVDIVENFPGVHRVEFFGSVNTNRWVRGRSDIDIKIYGNNISGDDKRAIELVLRDLNSKYGLGLENVRCAHPTPFFLDSPSRIELFENMMMGHSGLVETGRQILKNTAPTYGVIWQFEDAVKLFEQLPGIPRISDTFDKFR